MNFYLSLGRWLFAVPFALLGLQHFLDAPVMAESVIPNFLPAKEVFVYLTGALLIAASVSMLIGRYDKFAAVLLSVFLLSMIALFYLPNILHAPNRDFFVPPALKDIALAGAAMMYARNYAQDRAIVG